ncbi:MAG: hypothetical protein K2N94_08800, partial [Lachnospiraceae bacterium]|nr:hypothetical protein [Lachnospiraceae bacterium]
MRKKKFGALLMSACMAVSLTACGGDSEKTPTPTPATDPTKAPEVTQPANPEPTKGEQAPEPTKAEDTPAPTQEASVPQGDPVVIRYGTHWVR